MVRRMEDKDSLADWLRIPALVIGAAACMVGACCFMPLALAGSALLLVALATTREPAFETDACCEDEAACQRPDESREEPPGPALAFDTGTHWRQTIADAANRRSATVERAA